MVCGGAGEPREEGRETRQDSGGSEERACVARCGGSEEHGAGPGGKGSYPSSRSGAQLGAAPAPPVRQGPRCQTPAASGVRSCAFGPPQVSLAFPLRFSSAPQSVCAELGAACKAPQGASAASRDAPASPRAPAARGPAQRPRRSARLRSADRGGGRVVGTDTTRLLCLARTQSRARSGGGSGSHFMAPGPTSCLHPKSFGISIHRGLGHK